MGQFGDKENMPFLPRWYEQEEPLGILEASFDGKGCRRRTQYGKLLIYMAGWFLSGQEFALKRMKDWFTLRSPATHGLFPERCESGRIGQSRKLLSR